MRAALPPSHIKMAAVALQVWVALLIVSPLARASGPAVLGPDQGPYFMRTVAGPGDAGAPTEAARCGWTCTGIRVDPAQATFAFQSTAGASATATLRHPSTCAAPIIGPLAAFCLQVEPAPSPDPCGPSALERSLRQGVAANPLPVRWIEPEPTPGNASCPDQRANEPRPWVIALMALLALYAVARSVVAWRSIRAHASRPRSCSEPWWVRHAFWIETSAVVACAFAAQMSGPTGDNLVLHSDSMRNALIAQDCLAGHGCHLRLNSAGGMSVSGFWHGAVFNHFLVLPQWLGLAAGQLIVLQRLATGVAVGLVFAATRRWAGRWVALVIAALTLRLFQGEPFLWNVSLIPTPAALTAAAGACFVWTRRPVFALVAALSVAIGLQTHLAFAALVPSLVLMVLLAARRRVLLLAECLAVTGVVVIVGSPTMFDSVDLAMAGMLLRKAGFASPLRIAAGAALLAAMVALLARLRTLGSARARLLWWLGVAYGLPALAALASAQTASRYAEPLYPGLLLLAIGVWSLASSRGLLRRLPSWSRLVAIALAAVVVLWTSIRTSSGAEKGWTVGDARAVAQYLRSRGWSFAAAFRHVRGAQEHDALLSGLAVFFPQPDAAASAPAQDLLVAHVPRGSASQLGGWVPIAERKGETVLLKAYDPWLKWDRFELGVPSVADPAATVWKTADYALAVPFSEVDSGFWFTRAMPRTPELEGEARAYVVLRVPVRVPPGATVRRLHVLAHPGKGMRMIPGMIVQVQGLDHAGDLPASTLRVAAGASPQQGVITFAWSGCDGDTPREVRIPPAVLELNEAEPVPVSVVSRAQSVQGDGRLCAPALGPPGEPEERPLYRCYPPEPLGPLWYVLTVSLLLAMAMSAGIALCLVELKRGDEPS